MKNVLISSLKLFLTIFLCLLVQQAHSQVSVTATAGTAGPTSYTTLSAAFTAINSGTHQGDITINITGNVTQPAAPQALYASGISTALYTSILIKPDAPGRIINSAATPTGSRGIIDLLGADNITIDGSATGGTSQDLTIQVNGTTNLVPAIRLEGGTTAIALGCNNIVIKNVIIIGNSITNTGMHGIAAATAYTSGTASSTMTATGTSADNDNVTIQNCNISKCYVGIYAAGTAAVSAGGMDNWTITNNIIGPASAGTNNIGFKGIHMQGAFNANI